MTTVIKKFVNIILAGTLILLTCFLLTSQLSYAQPNISKDTLVNQLKRKVKGTSNNWKKTLKRSPQKAAAEARNFQKELEKLTKFVAKDAKARIYALYLAEASKVMPVDDWCQLYGKYRGAENSPYKQTTGKNWKLADDYHKQVCLKKKVEPSGQGIKPCAKGESKIGELANKSNYSIELVGDGTTTDQSQIIVTNKDTGAQGSSIVKTMCSSTRLHKPPPTRNIATIDNLNFMVAASNPYHVAIIKSAEKLAKQGTFSKLGLPNAKAQVAQNAIWKVEADKTGDPQHQITNATIKKRILKNVDRELPPEVDKALTQRVDEILACVNLTIKESKPTTEPPPKKKDDDNITPPPVTENGTTVSPPKNGEEYCIPPFTAFKPSDEKYQEMITTEKGNIFLCSDLDNPLNGKVGNENDNADITGTGGNISDKTTDENDGIGEKPKKNVTVELGILLTRGKNGDQWIPTNPSVTTVLAQIYERALGGRDWKPSSRKKIIQFIFTEVSNETGECMNSGDKKWVDLLFEGHKNPDLICTDKKSQINGVDTYGSAKTKKEVHKQEALVSCDDFGAYSTIEAIADGCTPLKCIDGVIRESNKAEIKVPKDDNNNKIADAYEDKVGEHPGSEDDIDKEPPSKKMNGDGLTAYEEYRGFRVQGKFKRTSWKKKDLFIEDKDGIGFGEFPEASGIVCHNIKMKEYDYDRIVNFNRGFPAGKTHPQTGLELIEDKRLNMSSLGESTVGPPKYVQRVKINRLALVSYQFLTGKYDREDPKLKERKELELANLAKVVTHELGHASGVKHHGTSRDASGNGELKTINPSKGESEKNYWISRGGEAHIGDILCGKKLPREFWIGKKGNNMSGDIYCYMHYPNSLISEPAVYRFDGSFECSDKSVVEKIHFCKTKTGTGFNAGGHNAGDATNGACKTQFVINDRYNKPAEETY